MLAERYVIRHVSLVHIVRHVSVCCMTCITGTYCCLCCMTCITGAYLLSVCCTTCITGAYCCLYVVRHVSLVHIAVCMLYDMYHWCILYDMYLYVV